MKIGFIDFQGLREGRERLDRFPRFPQAGVNAFPSVEQTSEQDDPALGTLLAACWLF